MKFLLAILVLAAVASAEDDSDVVAYTADNFKVIDLLEIFPTARGRVAFLLDLPNTYLVHGHRKAFHKKVN